MSTEDLELSAGIGPDEDRRAAFWRLFTKAGAPSREAGLKALRRMALLKTASGHHRMTMEQCEALAIFMTQHGVYWKSMLRRSWLTGTAPVDLKALRYSHGPSWLDRFRLDGDPDA